MPESSRRALYPSVRISIDRGGTFTDIYAEIEHDNPSKSTYHVLKLLSKDPANYRDAPTEGIRRILSLATSTNHDPSLPLDTSHIQSIRMGTTIATNALLERAGEPCALVTTTGFADILAIGNQSRPRLFDLSVRKQPPLCAMVVEAPERVVLSKPHSTLTVRHNLDEAALAVELRRVQDAGITSLAVALMHSYAFPDHEIRVHALAKTLGFQHVSLSSALTPMVKIVPRAFTATVDAYLTPHLRAYISDFKDAFDDGFENIDVQFMRSDGGLCHIDAFCGYVAILSGPAGGVVGYARTSYGFERNAPEHQGDSPLPVIGFDMGGTSTDVSRYSGRFEHVFETETAGVTIQAPQLDIHTVAAGGGSRLFYRCGIFFVGPESAGAHPGPVCYRKGGHLTVTDANLMLGRIQPPLFPHIFGKNADLPLDMDATREAFIELTVEINSYARAMNEPEMTPEDVADGFIKVANEAMCRPIRQLTEGKGHDVRDHSLSCFGGAGGQHACAIAKSLGIRTVFVHKYSGVLSAYGIALADSVVDIQEPLDIFYSDCDSRLKAFIVLKRLRTTACNSLKAKGFQNKAIQSEQYLNLRYEGTDFGIMVQCPKEMQDHVEEVNFENLFVTEYSREHGFHIPGRQIIIEDVRVRALGNISKLEEGAGKLKEDVHLPTISLDGSGKVLKDVKDVKPAYVSKCYYLEEGGWLKSEVWRIGDLPKGNTVLPGPCIIVDASAGNTIVVDPGCVARVASDGNVFINIGQNLPVMKKSQDFATNTHVDHVKLSVYGHRFMGIAEQMGRTLQRTSISTNIKERLDFSCALFDETGGLVANAPHVPVHLGAMQDAVRYQIRTLGDNWREGEVLLSNHPVAGGTHLPDITIITPVYHEGRVVFYVASRGHHADIGGKTPGSMPPFSKRLTEEGFAMKSMKLVRDGLFQELEISQHLQDSGCRCLTDVISDLRAQVAANQKGITLLSELIASQGLGVVQAYMHFIQKAAAQAVRQVLKDIAQKHGVGEDQKLKFVDYMDDGTAIKLSLSIDAKNGSAIFDFTESGGEVEGNTNAPKSITSSAVIYVLRCLVDLEIPLNQGCLDPITVKLPTKSILSPSPTAAVIGGNILTSQRVTDVILGAFEVCAASQGCMNNFTFGDSSMGYYETIAGGAGAGPSWHGTSGVQTHMTNTRMTDPEILERRYPVVLRQFSFRKDSGGLGKWKGGDGLIRAIEFTKPVTVSILSERRIYRPWGLHGGQDGKSGKNELIRKDGSSKDLGNKSSFEIQTGDIIQISTPGGGGFGKE